MSDKRPKTPVEPTTLVSDERKPLSYYMNNALWYFGQPPDPISGQVVPRSTVESWMERTKEMEVNLAKMIAERDELVDRAKEAEEYLVMALGSDAFVRTPDPIQRWIMKARDLLSKYK